MWLDLMGWAFPGGLAHVQPYGYRGSYPHRLPSLGNSCEELSKFTKEQEISFEKNLKKL
jgi:hypothetical protein